MIWYIGTYHLLEMPSAEDRVVDLDRFGGDDVGHGDYLDTSKEVVQKQKDIVCGALLCLNGGTGGQVTSPLTK
jgi:hypothetical protein